jgi:hypothetical protein
MPVPSGELLHLGGQGPVSISDTRSISPDSICREGRALLRDLGLASAR